MTAWDWILAALCAAWLAALAAISGAPWAIPKDLPAWVQAVGSVGAILAGFGYVIYQTRLRRADELADQKDVRLHCSGLIATAMDEMDDRIVVFEKSVAEEGRMSIRPMADFIHLISNELLTISPTACGSGKLSIYYRQIALYLNAVAETSAEIGNSSEQRASSEQVDHLKDLRILIKQTQDEVMQLELNSRR